MRILVNILRVKWAQLPWHEHAHHIVLGDGDVRLCCFKNEPELWQRKDGIIQKVAISRRDLGKQNIWAMLKAREIYHYEYSGELKLNDQIWTWTCLYWLTYKSEWKHHVFDHWWSPQVKMDFKEPDGTKWFGHVSYEHK